MSPVTCLRWHQPSQTDGIAFCSLWTRSSRLSREPLTMTGSWCEGRATLLAPCRGFVGPGAHWQGSQSLRGCVLWRAEHRRDGCSLLCLTSLHWLGRHAENCQRSACQIPGTHHPRSLSSNNLLHFVASDQLPCKAKMSQHGSAGAVGQAGAQAERGACYPR